MSPWNPEVGDRIRVGDALHPGEETAVPVVPAPQRSAFDAALSDNPDDYPDLQLFLWGTEKRGPIEWGVQREMEPVPLADGDNPLLCGL